jgi:hypothetical protein
MTSAPKLETEKANWFRENLKTTQKRFLTYRIAIDENDLKMGWEASGCCASRYTPDVMDELFVLPGCGKTAYFRPWNGSKLVRNDVFD